jgi:nucleotide-binding universal stress UspA family protein
MYATILVPIDGSITAERGLDEAIALALRLGSTLHLIHVADDGARLAEASAYAPPEQLVEDWRIAGERLVPAALERARASGVTADGVVRSGPQLRVCEAIVQEARRVAADLIVMGTHGRSDLSRLALGSNAESVSRTSPVPVMLVRVP